MRYIQNGLEGVVLCRTIPFGPAFEAGVSHLILLE